MIDRAIAVVLAIALAAVGGWGAWQAHTTKALRADRDHWRAEAQTATDAAAKAEAAHAVAIITLKAEQARNRDYDAIRAAIEDANDAPIDPAIADTLRRLCARDPHCDDPAKGGR